MDASCTSMACYRGSKLQGKVRRRVQDLRIPSSSYYDYIANRPTLDLSHNESARLAVDSLLSHGLEEYDKVLKTEGEVDFLSELEKSYILQNVTHGSTADSGASDDEVDGNSESSSADSQSATPYPVTSTNPDPTVSDFAPDESNVEVYFQSDRRAAGMKDLVREFITKAKMALAIVMDSFSDVELLCDLLEASRKRNVSVHLLLDHLNLNLFVSMWQDLNLSSKNFPKLSVRSVDGQTYCAKTGRKLTGQIAESFIIIDWTEALTGSFSFSWLSWQVHRSLAVLSKGSMVVPFHQEFHRLYSSSKPVPGFVTYITVPQTLPPHTTLHAAQRDNTEVSMSKSSQAKTICHGTSKEDAQNIPTKTNTLILCNPQSPETECSKESTQPVHRADTSAQMHDEAPIPGVQLGALACVSAEKSTVWLQHGAQTSVEPLEKNQNHIQSDSDLLSRAHISHVQSQLASLTVTTAAEKNMMVQESNRLHTASPTQAQHRTVCYQSPFRTNSNLEHNVATEGLFFHQRNTHRLLKPLGFAACTNTHRQQRYSSLHSKQKVDFPADYSKILSPSTSQQLAKANILFPLTQTRGHISGLQIKNSCLESRKQDHPNTLHQLPLQLQATTEAPGAKSSLTAMSAFLQTQLQADSKLLSPCVGTRIHIQAKTSPQVMPPPRLNWMPQSRTARPRPPARHSSFNATYGTGQQAINTSLGRSKSVNYRHSAGFKGGGLN